MTLPPSILARLPRPPERVLEIGGDGAAAFALAQLGYLPTVASLDDGAAHRARRALLSAPFLVQNRVTAVVPLAMFDLTPFSDASFPVILVVSLPDKLPAPVTALCRILAPRGLLVAPVAYRERLLTGGFLRTEPSSTPSNHGFCLFSPSTSPIP